MGDVQGLRGQHPRLALAGDGRGGWRKLTSDVRLVQLCDEHRGRFEEMLAEFREHGDVGLYTGFYAAAWDGFDAYRAMLARLCAGGWPHPDVVPGAAAFIMDGERIVGEVYLRFGLTPQLEVDGGNVGYQVRPSQRRRGYGSAGLRLALARLAERGLERALLTCDDRNVASIRLIERCVGVRTSDALLAGGTRNRRYWLRCAPS